MLRRSLLVSLALSVLVLLPANLLAQGRPYTEGSVWAVTMIRTTAGMGDDYLRGLATTWKRTMDEAKKQGFVVSYKIISTGSSGADDWDLLLLEEYKNWAALDGIADKFEPIDRKIVGDETASRNLATKRLEVRRILGSKLGQELILK